MTFSSFELLQDLIEKTKDILNQAQYYTELNTALLQSRPTSDSWNILECFEHLNRYHAFYNAEIRQRIAAAPKDSTDTFQSGWLGNYFANSMLPKEKLNKMNTFKKMNPIGTALNKSVITRFINYQHELLEILNAAIDVNLTKTKTAITISNIIKLRLGDTLRVLIYHNIRHMVQVRKIKEQSLKQSAQNI